MENPFDSGHIKNYILAYASVVVIMILFFIASTIFHEEKIMQKKVFKTKEVSLHKEQKNIEQKRENFGIKVIDKNVY